jgi:hypothetical protein
MLQVRETLTGPLTNQPVAEGTWLWARLDNEQLETWLGDYMWFVDFGDSRHRNECSRTCDELIVECALRNRHDLIRRAWVRLARNPRSPK